MKKEKSAGAVIYRLEKGEPVYLLLHYPPSPKATSEYWDLPKGHVERGETEEDTVRREVKEETGLENIELRHGFRETIHYWFQWKRKKISKTVAFYLAKTGEKEITISEEHIGFVWLPYAKAIEKLTYQNAKQLIQKANDYL
ncbi:MAG TPA: NUDIX domain-containing protein [Candidatus Paceibacterota bacterium]